MNAPEMTFRQALGSKDFVLTANVNLAQAATADSVLQQGNTLYKAVDAVQLNDNPSAQVHMSTIAAAALLLQQGIDPIVHMTCRDRNRIALQSDLIGAAALGVSSVLLMHGDKIPANLKPKVTGVFDTKARELMSFVRDMKRAEAVPLVSDFQVGTVATVLQPQQNWTPDALMSKYQAGANFVLTQICFDIEVLRSYMSHMVQSKMTHKLAFVIALSPLPSAEAARWMRDNMRGALMPDWVVERMESASNPEQEGIDICAELLRELSTIPGVRGANLLTLGNIETIPAAIEASGLRAT